MVILILYFSPIFLDAVTILDVILFFTIPLWKKKIFLINNFTLCLSHTLCIHIYLKKSHKNYSSITPNAHPTVPTLNHTPSPLASPSSHPSSTLPPPISKWQVGSYHESDLWQHFVAVTAKLRRDLGTEFCHSFVAKKRRNDG